MTTADYIAYGVGALGFVFGLVCYRELWKWAKQCQRAEIAIAFKRRTQLRAPLTEWLMWANALAKDESANGRAIYRNGGVTVAILRPRTKGRAAASIARVRGSRARRKAAA